MFTVGVLGGLAPILIRRIADASRARRSDHNGLDEPADSELSPPDSSTGGEGRVLRLLELISGGVLFGVAVFHLIPEGLEPLRSFEDKNTHGFPFGFAVFSIGFLITVGLEMVAVPLLVEYKRLSKRGAQARHALLSQKDANDTCNVESPSTSTSHDQGADNAHDPESLLKSTAATPGQDESAEVDDRNSAIASDTLDVMHDSDKSWRSVGAAAATFAGLSMHAFFAGLSLGIGSLDQTIFLFIAIISHKGFGTFAIGLQLVRAKVSLLTHAAVVTAFALISPVGVVIGLAVDQSVDSITASTLQLLAAGMLFSVAVVGSLGFDANENKRTAVTSYLAYVTGVLSMGLIFITLAFTDVLESGHGTH